MPTKSPGAGREAAVLGGVARWAGRVYLRWAFMVFVASALAGCLPTGTPPAGRYVVSDRTMSGVYFALSEVETRYHVVLPSLGGHGEF